LLLSPQLRSGPRSWPGYTRLSSLYEMIGILLEFFIRIA